MDFAWPTAVLIEGPDALAGWAPTLVREGGAFWVSWHEAGHERRRLVSRWVEETPERLVFEDDNDQRYTFTRLTLGLYNERVRQHTIGKPVFESEEAMLAAMAAEW